MGVAEMPLLALGFLFGAVIYAIVAYAAVGAARTVVAGLLSLYWRWRTDREAARERARIAEVQRLPVGRAERRRSRARAA